jgi:hypothetical protein
MIGEIQKYRKKVLTREVEEYLKDVIMEIAKEKGFEIYATGEKFLLHTYTQYRYR